MASGLPTGSRPINARQARVWNYLARQEFFFPIKDWPSWAQQAILMEHKYNSERYQLFVFLTNNGLGPEMSGELILMKDYRNNTIIFGDYDSVAYNQVMVQMPAQLANGTLWKGHRKNFDIATGKVTSDTLDWTPDKGIPKKDW